MDASFVARFCHPNADGIDASGGPFLHLPFCRLTVGLWFRWSCIGPPPGLGDESWFVSIFLIADATTDLQYTITFIINRESPIRFAVGWLSVCVCMQTDRNRRGITCLDVFLLLLLLLCVLAYLPCSFAQDDDRSIESEDFAKPKTDWESCAVSRLWVWENYAQTWKKTPSWWWSKRKRDREMIWLITHWGKRLDRCAVLVFAVPVN